MTTLLHNAFPHRSLSRFCGTATHVWVYMKGERGVPAATPCVVYRRGVSGPLAMFATERLAEDYCASFDGKDV